MARLVAALSGGVDSAVAAARMVEAGHEVTGVHLALSRNPLTYRTGSRGCCSLEDANDARRVADILGIPFYVWDFSAEFHHDVVEDFLAEYARGRTPNPCLRCNEKIKFAALNERAVALGFDGVVTGHYASLRTRPDGLIELHRGVDQAKDQSYVLGVLTQEQLRHSYFPLGDTVKSDVRAEARRRGLRVADKPDSYDICFIPEGDTADYLHDKLGRRPGVIRDESGVVLGEHDGVFTYTIGQRKGLSLGRPSADGRPRYVLRLDPVDNTVTVGPREHLQVSGLLATDPLWCDQAPTAGFEATVQLRAHADEIPALIRPVEQRYVTPADQPPATTETGHVRTSPSLDITLHQPAYGIAPGQTAVIYDGTRVVGSATIDQTR